MSVEVTTHVAQGDDVEAIIRGMEETFIGKPLGDIHIACLAVAIHLQHPKITNSELLRGIELASLSIAEYLATLEAQDSFSLTTKPVNTQIN